MAPRYSSEGKRPRFTYLMIGSAVDLTGSETHSKSMSSRWFRMPKPAGLVLEIPSTL